ncbi:tetratricopeptide repeat protein [Myxococcus sp. K15C18031901]|uniref:tetratricopeptide repeat protein n=1 Tax=Myxococcus dinghuensis TaxID=2906761 RepID=UPI0020A6F75F|nr:tetratricopeptide repeat protein [Myxococcus dinghuensis]MCP3103014.1 tetratricopeptide repeat protein [Myxococcus dinghuensis]
MRLQVPAADSSSVLLPLAPSPTASSPTPELLDAVRDLYERGLYLQAFQRTQGGVPMARWTGTRARVLAGRLLHHLGAVRASRLQWTLAWREAPRDPEVRYYFASLMLKRRGPLPTLAFLDGPVDLETASVELRADLLLCRAECLIALRDFEDAGRWVREALALAPRHPWCHVMHSHLLEEQDRREEALEACRRALALRPWYRPAVQTLADLLTELGRDEEALAFLREASATLEVSSVSGRLALMLGERGLHDEAWAQWERALVLAPMLDAKTFGMLAAMRSDTAYLRGDVALALDLAWVSGSPFHANVARRLEARPEGRRVLLPVRFVRQHHKTCAPATLVSVAALWNVPVAHLQVAEAICYDGTPAYQERHWAATTGWHVREFRVTWESARALLDAGIAFTLTTRAPGSAHLQAVVGYDERRGTLLVRDPSTPHLVEFDTDASLVHFASCGPRGMAMVPLAEAARLDAIELPEAALYDDVHRMDAALVDNERAEALAIVESMARVAPDHRLVWESRRAVAAYDDSSPDALAALEGLRAAHPDDLNYLLAWLGHLGELGRGEERLSVLRERARGPRTHPLIWHSLAADLLSDARHEAEAEWLLLRTLRVHSTFAPAYRSLANLRWTQQRRAEALGLYRAAACLEDTNEGHAWSYFLAAQSQGDTARALAFLTDRFQRLGALNAGPAQTLCRAREELDQTAEAFAVLERARALRPEDGELTLFTAQLHARFGQAEEAKRLLESSRHVREGAWLRASAMLASSRGELEAALIEWELLLILEPLAQDAHAERVRLLTALKGVPAARARLETACARFPHHHGLLRLRVQWAREYDAGTLPAAVAAMLAVHPDDPWALREHSRLLVGEGRREEALAVLDRVALLEPRSASLSFARGRVLEAEGRGDEAAAAYRQSLTLLPSPPATAALLELATTAAERRASLDFVRETLAHAPVIDETVLVVEEYGRQVYSPEELGAWLEALLTRRPESKDVWVARLRHLPREGRKDEALALAERATAHFPLLGQLWLERALVHRARKEAAGERAALERACRLSPGWARPTCELSELLERQGEKDEARAVLERLRRENPLDGTVLGFLAELMWRSDAPDEALAYLTQALRLDVAYGWGWERMVEWSEEAGRLPEAVALARELTARPDNPVAARWKLAELLELQEGEDSLAERLSLLDSVLESAPRMADAHDSRARMLCAAGRHEEALAACSPAIYGGNPPPSLRGRAAWVLAQRGDLRAAIRDMTTVVELSPDYLWGWSQLAEWGESLQDAAVNLRALEALVAQRPESPSLRERMGDARARAGDVEGALAAWALARELAPRRGIPSLKAFDLLLKHRRLDEAATELERAKGLCDEALFEARHLQLAAARGDARAAGVHLKRMVFTLDDDNGWPLSVAKQVVKERGWTSALDSAVELAVHEREGELPQSLARHWGTRQAERPLAWRVWGRLRGLLDSRASAVEAVGAYVERLGELHRVFLMPLFLWMHGGLLRRHVRLWGAMGYALMQMGWMGWAWRWMSDWREYPVRELRPWMLLNVTVLGYLLGNTQEAEDAVERGLGLPEDHARPSLRVWGAFLLALGGSQRALDEALEGLEAPPDEPLLKLLKGLAEAMRAARVSGAQEARAALRRAEAAGGDLRSNGLAQRAYRDAVARIRERVGRDAWSRSG